MTSSSRGPAAQKDMSAFHYYVCLICFLLSLRPVLVNAASCSTTTEGSLRLTGNAGNDHQYLQVCHIQNWGYVCNSEFDHSIDREVVLQQLDCNTGDTSWDIMSTNKGYELGDCPCFGVEKMLINCPRYFKLQQKTCYWKVSVQCDSQGAVTRQCLNGELMKSNTNILYLCVSGRWTKLCSNLWGNSQESVACRQLSQETLTQYDGSDEYFKNYIHCTGQERNIMDCRFTSVEDNDCTKTPVKLMCKKVEAPVNIVFRSTNSVSVGANWTQPSSDLVQYYTNHTITCTSTHGVYTATQHVNVSAAVNESMHTIITGLMANTSYNCCVSVYSELGRSEDLCDSVITAGFRTKISVRTTPTSVVSDAQHEANSSPLPWVAGIIIGAVLSAAILLTVIVAVYLWRKKAQSQYKMSDSSTERRVSLSQTNQCYSNVTQEPQAYEEFQPNRQDHQPAAADGVYSYADHTVNTNVYDSVPQSNESSDCYGNSKEDTTMPTVDNTALYSQCEQENGAYSQLNRK